MAALLVGIVLACSEYAVRASTGAPPTADDTGILPTALADDSECPAGAAEGDGQRCALNAMQLRARRQQQLDSRQGPTADEWGQCGGSGWTGATACPSGYACMAKDEWYAQCRPNGDPMPAPAPRPPPVRELPVGPAPTMAPLLKSHYYTDTEKPEPAGSIYPVIVKGNFLYDSVTGKRFFAKGVAYNPRGERYDKSFGRTNACVAGHPPGGLLPYTEDVQADKHEAAWSQDLDAIAKVGANTVRLYNVDPKLNHSRFMTKAASLGLYVIVPLNGKDWGYLPAFPSPDCYTQDIENYGNVGVNALSFAKQLVKQFSQYPNTLLFTVANELAVNDKNGYAAFPCVKALTRDIHRYQSTCASSMRRVPLIYSDVDMGPPDRKEIAQYLTCALESDDDAVDAYGLNVYSWCDETYPDETGKDNFQYSPYSVIRDDFKDFSKPVLMTEFGCVSGVFHTKCPYAKGRTWPDFKYMVGKAMGEILSGAVAFQFSMDKEEYGLVMTPGFVANQTELYLLDNYFALKKVFTEYHASSKWDGAEAANCAWSPSDAAPMSHPHKPSVCPAKKVWMKIQKQRGVDKVGPWDVLPPPATAPLGDLGQGECPTYTVPDDLLLESQCHTM